ncbi:MAG: flavin-containing monooxygenase [Candidatus Hodarchaeales archaeon]|jgi:putative flavoprotein involved in K+ transport
MNEQTVNTVVVGGGQAGLSTSYYLKSKGIEHLVLEQAERPAYAWREQKWESFCFVIPNWSIRLPGGSYQNFGSDPDGFILRDELVNYFEEYIQRHDLPLKLGNPVSKIYQEDGHWIVEGKNNRYIANNVIIATGFFQTPKVPTFSNNFGSEIYQVHTSEYKNPSELNDGAVLVVGTGQSGMQIAEELYKLGKRVHLSVGTTGRLPRGYRGKDIVYWLEKVGFFKKPVKTLESPKDRFGSNPHVSGVNGGHDLNIHQFYKDGVSLYGHLEDVSSDGSVINFKDDLHELINKNDESEKEFLTIIDKYIEENGIKAEDGYRNQLTGAYEQEILRELNLSDENITNIVWGTGYNRDYSFINQKSPVVDEMGFPIQESGVSPHQGLYFIGMPWISNPGSGLLYGVGDDARYIVNHLNKRRNL